MQTYCAYRVHKTERGVEARLDTLPLVAPAPGEVLIRAEYSSVNFKDALACTGAGNIIRRFPLVAGIDVAGVIEASAHPDLQAGDAVLVTGCGMGEDHDGGYAEYVTVPGDWVVSLPPGLTSLDAMALGTAGFTAALALHRLQQNGLQAGAGPVLVSGATGGVGSLAVNLFSDQGHAVTALTGKPGQEDYLLQLGAGEVLDRNRLEMGQRPLEKARWAAAVDNVGGATLAWLTRTLQPWGGIASIGLTGGQELHTTVMPFILRGVSVLGISSSNCPMPLRRELWGRLATDWRPSRLQQILLPPLPLAQLPTACERLIKGAGHGRQVVLIGA